MKAFGYQKNSEELMELNEVSFRLSYRGIGKDN